MSNNWNWNQPTPPMQPQTPAASQPQPTAVQPAQPAYAPQQGHPPAQPAYDPMYAMRVKAGVSNSRESDYITAGKYIVHVTGLKYTEKQSFVVEGRVLWSQDVQGPVMRPQQDGSMVDKWEPARPAGGSFSIVRKLDPIGAKDINQYEGVLLHGLDPRTQEAAIMPAIQANPGAMPLAMADARAIPHPVVAVNAFLNKKGSFTIANMRPIPAEVLARIQADQGVQDAAILASLW